MTRYVANNYQSLSENGSYLFSSSPSVNTYLGISVVPVEDVVIRIYENPDFNDSGSDLVLSNTDRVGSDRPLTNIFKKASIVDKGFLIFDFLAVKNIRSELPVFILNGEFPYLMETIGTSGDGVVSISFFVDEVESFDSSAL